MADTIEINGAFYHEDHMGHALLDEDNNPIPEWVCICAARDPYECSCGAWDVPIPSFKDP